MANRPPRALKNDETIDLGGKKVRWLDTPHVPHNWDAGLLYEETTGTLFSSDLFTQFGACPATTSGDIVDAAIATEKAVPFMPLTPLAAPTLRRLAALNPKTIALMHGPSFMGDGGRGPRRTRELLREAPSLGSSGFAVLPVFSTAASGVETAGPLILRANFESAEIRKPLKTVKNRRKTAK